MKIMIGADHPKQVHFWRNIVRNLIEDGHEVKILTIDKDVTLRLLSTYGLDYEIYGKHQKSMTKKAYSMISSTYKAFIIAKRFMPDILIAGTPYLSYVGKMLGKPHIMLTDTEHANLAYWLTYPFTDVVITPSCFKGKINPKKHVTYNGYEELAYLHPNYFAPDPSVLEGIGLNGEDTFIIIRLISWEASHDTYSKGISSDLLERAIRTFEEYGRVFITSERKLDKNLKKYKLNIEPEKLHSALYYASLYFGEGGATATEAALLGTPSVHVEAVTTMSGEVMDVIQAQHIGIRDELMNRYKIAYTFADQNQAVDKALQILQDDRAKQNMKSKIEKLMDEKIDVTRFMVDFIERYSESFYEYKLKGKTI